MASSLRLYSASASALSRRYSRSFMEGNIYQDTHRVKHFLVTKPSIALRRRLSQFVSASEPDFTRIFRSLLLNRTLRGT
jgi:hypothetical protein